MIREEHFLALTGVRSFGPGVLKTPEMSGLFYFSFKNYLKWAIILAALSARATAMLSAYVSSEPSLGETLLRINKLDILCKKVPE
jgi:hypothetical protein